LRVAARGTKDRDLAVRQRCLRALERTVAVVAGHVPSSEGRPLKGLPEFLPPILEALDEVVPVALEAASTKDVPSCLAALGALEEAGAVRLLLRDLDPKRRFLEGLDEAVAVVRRLLPHEEARVRLGALQVMEVLGSVAGDAAGGIVQRLEDEDRHVRWAAARALRNMAPARAEPTPLALGNAPPHPPPHVP